MVAAVSGANNEVLEAGVGKVERIFVVVPINGQLQIAQGGVFSYYEFKQPRSDRLTDEEWQKKLTTNSPSLMAYTKNYLQPGGKTVDSLALRVGDIFIVIRKALPPIKVRRILQKPPMWSIHSVITRTLRSPQGRKKRTSWFGGKSRCLEPRKKVGWPETRNGMTGRTGSKISTFYFNKFQ